jgi:hypothetical protein
MEGFIMGFILAFAGLVQGLGIVGGLAFFALVCWFTLTTRGRAQLHVLVSQVNVEYRCRSCGEREDCPASDTNTDYPCEYFKGEQHG